MNEQSLLNFSKTHFLIAACVGLMVGGELFFAIDHPIWPFVEVFCGAFISLVYVNAWAAIPKRVTANVIGKTKSKTKEPKQTQISVAKSVTKQLMLSETVDTFEHHLTYHLLSQIEKTGYDSDDLPLGLLRLIAQNPHLHLDVHLWPIATYPQHKIWNSRCEVFYRTEGCSQKFVAKNGMTGLFFLIQTVRMLRHYDRLHTIVDFPTEILKYPKLIQHFFDYAEHKEAGLQHISWRTDDESNKHQMIWSRLKEQGWNFISQSRTAKTENQCAHTLMDWADFKKISDADRFKQTPLSIRGFVQQVGVHTILGNVPKDVVIDEPFDSIYGPYLGEPIVLKQPEKQRLAS